MAPPYSSGGQSYGSYGYGYGNSYRQSSYSHRRKDSDSTSLMEDIRAAVANGVRWSWRFWNERGRHMVLAALVASARRLRRNLTYNRLFSIPHLLVAIWVLVLLWGERWTFHTKVESCRWDKWENWPAGADPHHLVLVADPQLIDHHSYPGRPWFVNDLTFLITDNYLRRSYNQLISQLDPDTIFFLGDLFDGGREWKTAHGDFRDAEWAPHPKSEQKYLKKWNKKYNEFYWLKEYARFGDIFMNPWVKASRAPGAEHKRRKLVASLPGNHDLGFGADIKIPVRNRFEAYFGEGNRVDVVGNHTFVSVDSVSLSAEASPIAQKHDLRPVYKPTEHFLLDIKRLKRRAVEKELRVQRGEEPELKFNHRIENLESANFDDKPFLGKGAPELPTILLTHVPLYRPEGTPCGPLREHWPPAKPPAGQTDPVFPDHRNAISVSRGYQYQNVLSEHHSVSLIEKIGNVVHAFSGDDHDYCEVIHAANQKNVPEITVKSISMAMGVPTPGFLMVSMYNPLDGNGQPLLGDKQPTLQTHLCLLPTQLTTYIRYVLFALLCIALLTVRALLVPVLHLTPFALPEDPWSWSGGGKSGPRRGGFLLPVFKTKVEDYEEYSLPSGGGFGGTSSSRLAGLSATASRSGSTTGSKKEKGHHHHSRRSSHSHSGKTTGGGGGGKWGWGGPKIEIPSDNDDEGYGGHGNVNGYNSGGGYDGGKWKAAKKRGPSSTGPRSAASLVITELWTTLFRVVWMALVVFGWLAYQG
ncbi:calcineurin-like phosphoesterase-domain-containing protein [Rhypophila decipiens]|uniref:Calcineurin-like phosphoesterase-domain-containing protein n=1 Tax=Rhypophila decipiens TaxID=261697 RepID=A0AAN6YEJ6_9PEZI|nr:calcineurin-like phosphoesterase-domain-containing protein [Rhypophila decipiens]